MHKKLLVVIDYQNDFVAPEGKLTAGKPAQALEEYIDARAARYLAEGQDVVFTLDTHTAQEWAAHPESAQFPLHCEKGSWGWEIYGAPARHIGKAELVEKKAYCPAFSVLDDWVDGYDEICLLGVATDICILQTAIGLYTAKVINGSAVSIQVDDAGCASFNPEGHAYALKYMHETLGM